MSRRVPIWSVENRVAKNQLKQVQKALIERSLEADKLYKKHYRRTLLEEARFRGLLAEIDYLDRKART